MKEKQNVEVAIVQSPLVFGRDTVDEFSQNERLIEVHCATWNNACSAADKRTSERLQPSRAPTGTNTSRPPIFKQLTTARSPSDRQASNRPGSAPIPSSPALPLFSSFAPINNSKVNVDSAVENKLSAHDLPNAQSQDLTAGQKSIGSELDSSFGPVNMSALTLNMNHVLPISPVATTHKATSISAPRIADSKSPISPVNSNASNESPTWAARQDRTSPVKRERPATSSNSHTEETETYTARTPPFVSNGWSPSNGSAERNDAYDSKRRSSFNNDPNIHPPPKKRLLVHDYQLQNALNTTKEEPKSMSNSSSPTNTVTPHSTSATAAADHRRFSMPVVLTTSGDYFQTYAHSGVVGSSEDQNNTMTQPTESRYWPQYTGVNSFNRHIHPSLSGRTISAFHSASQGVPAPGRLPPESETNMDNHDTISSCFKTATPNGQSIMSALTHQYQVIDEIRALPQGECFQMALNGWDWYTVDGVRLPCVFRQGDKLMAVHMVQMRLLAKFPPHVPGELMRKHRMLSHKMSVLEAWIFNTINAMSCQYEYGYQLFSPNDEVVKAADVEKFYWAVKAFNLTRMVDIYRNEIRANADLHLVLTSHISSLKNHAESELRQAIGLERRETPVDPHGNRLPDSPTKSHVIPPTIPPRGSHMNQTLLRHPIPTLPSSHSVTTVVNSTGPPHFVPYNSPYQELEAMRGMTRLHNAFPPRLSQQLLPIGPQPHHVPGDIGAPGLGNALANALASNRFRLPPYSMLPTAPRNFGGSQRRLC